MPKKFFFIFFFFLSNITSLKKLQKKVIVATHAEIMIDIFIHFSYFKAFLKIKKKYKNVSFVVRN